MTTRRAKSIFAGFAVANLLFPVIAFAQDPSARSDTIAIVNNILSVVQIFVTIMFVLSIVVFGWGIVQFILAAGDPAAVKKAKSFLLWGVIGMAVFASIFGLVNWLQGYFGVESSRLIIPQPVIDGSSGTVTSGVSSTGSTGVVAPPPLPPPPP